DNFIEGFHFYADYVYTRHEKDKIKVIDDKLITIPNLTLDTTTPPKIDDVESKQVKRSTLFVPQKLRKESEWFSNSMNMGLNYSASPQLEFG
ncbi:hypothetical protein, partial [Listeria monocytogenes]|uniref:hypothetical protein n=1 Tax=Listeria monocytogenes TaxID=1639 RepID=UPI002FDBA267